MKNNFDFSDYIRRIQEQPFVDVNIHKIIRILANCYMQPFYLIRQEFLIMIQRF